MAALQHSTPLSVPGRLQALHGRMVASLLDGGALPAIAQHAAEVAGGRVVIDLPHDGLAASTPGDGEAIALRVPITTGGEAVGTVALHLDGPAPEAAPDALHAAAMATLTYVALLREDDHREDAGSRLVAAALDGAPRIAARLRAAGVEAGEALTVHLAPQRTGLVLAAIADHAPGAVRTVRDGWAFVLLPPGSDAPRLAAALHERLGVAAAGLPADHADPSGALRETRLAARVVADGAATPETVMRGTWRLLVRDALRAPSEIAALAAETLGPLIDPDVPAAAEQLRTFAAYVANDCNMNATAAAMPAHRHTVAYRLDRVRELTGLDPLSGEDRERLGVALKAHAVTLAVAKLTPPSLL
jgi:hypothetical protein